MKRMFVMVVATSVALATAAMPTKAELQKAQAMLSGLTAADVAALKAKTKTPIEVAAKHMELARQADNEAEKYLLLQGAFYLYAKGGDYDNAAKVIATMQAEIKNLNSEVISELREKAKVAELLPTAIVNRTFDLGSGRKLEMIGCPARTFKMSNAPGGPNGDGTHEVKLTRSFWIATSCVTRAMYKAFEADYDKNEKAEKKPDDLVTGRARAEAFAAWLNKRFQAKLPRGYVFRLPSEAEWEYAMNMGVVARHWNFEGTLDTVRAVATKANAWKFDVSVMEYAALEIDPVRAYDQNPAWVCRQDAKKRYLLRMDGPGCFRMVVGPDLKKP